VIISTLFCSVFFIAELVLDFLDRNFKANFWAKIFAMIWYICRVTALALWLADSLVDEVRTDVEYYVFFELGQTFCLFGYIVCIIVWLKFAYKIRQLGKQQSSTRNSKRILILVAIVFGPIIFTLSLMTSFGYEVNATNLAYMLFVAVVLLGLMSWSSWNVVLLIKLTKNQKFGENSKKLIKKNRIFGILNILMVFYIIHVALHGLLNVYRYPYPYLASQTLLRMEEIVMSAVFFFIVERYFSKGKCLSGYKKAWKTITSVATTGSECVIKEQIGSRTNE